MAYRSLPERRPLLDRVVVAPANTCTTHIPGVDEISDDLMRPSFADPNHVGDLAHARLRVPRDAEQDERVRSQERASSLVFTECGGCLRLWRSSHLSTSPGAVALCIASPGEQIMEISRRAYALLQNTTRSRRLPPKIPNPGVTPLNRLEPPWAVASALRPSPASRDVVRIIQRHRKC